MKAVWALALLLPGLAWSAATAHTMESWSIDAALSQVQFSVRKFWVAHERGTFPRLQGTLREIDNHVGADLLQVDAAVDVAGLQMQDPDHRARALGPDFFDAARYPWIRFDSDPFPMNELATGGTVSGMLSLHGERHPVALALQPSACPRQPLACVIRVRGSIDRSDFGMRALRGALSNSVALDLRIVLRSSLNTAPPALRPGSSAPDS